MASSGIPTTRKALARIIGGSWLIRVLTGCWLVTVTAGMGLLAAYSNVPGTRVPAISQWPAETQISPAQDASTVVMFLHPRCPCSRAAVRQLERILAHVSQPVALRFVFFRPEHEADTWAHTDLWRTAQTFDTAETFIDVDGVEARRFGATTSSHMHIFDQSGRCTFSGGITAGRGHEGDCPGSSAATEVLRQNPTAAYSCPTYGCPIVTEADSAPWKAHQR